MGEASILAWNCRGLGDASAIAELKKLIKQHKPGIVFLSETKRTADEIVRIRMNLGFDHSFAVDCIGRSGGLTLLWQEESTLQILSYSSSHIDVELTDPGGLNWRLTGFYGQPETSRRGESWTLLKSIKPASSLPWLCLGDFNEILLQSEKQGRNPRPYRQIEAFASTVDFHELGEMQFRGPPFTFVRKNNGAKGKCKGGCSEAEGASKVLLNNTGIAIVLRDDGSRSTLG